MASSCTVEELRSDFDRIAQQVEESGDPVFINRGGCSSVALVDVDSYLQDMQALREFRRIFEEGPKGKPLGE